MSTEQAVHHSRVANIQFDNKKKRKKFKPPKPQPASTSLTRGQLRKKIRDITRLLNASSSTASGTSNNAPGNHRPTKLSATARLEHERALAAYKHELSSQQLGSKQHTLEKRYHKVRFFERQKATRNLSRLQRQLATHDGGESEKDELLQKVHEAEVDLNYIMHYPGLEKYISLYKSGDSKDTNAKRDRIRNDVKRRMEEGTLHKGEALTLANAADGFGSSSAKKGPKGKNGQGLPDAEAGRDDENEDDEDEGSDGGFFEL